MWIDRAILDLFCSWNIDSSSFDRLVAFYACANWMNARSRVLKSGHKDKTQKEEILDSNFCDCHVYSRPFLPVRHRSKFDYWTMIRWGQCHLVAVTVTMRDHCYLAVVGMYSEACPLVLPVWAILTPVVHWIVTMYHLHLSGKRLNYNLPFSFNTLVKPNQNLCHFDPKITFRCLCRQHSIVTFKNCVYCSGTI